MLFEEEEKPFLEHKNVHELYSIGLYLLNNSNNLTEYQLAVDQQPLSV